MGRTLSTFDNERYYSLREASHKIPEMSPEKLRRHIAAGRVKGVKLGSTGNAQWLIPESAVEEYLRLGDFPPAEWARPSEIALMVGFNAATVRRMALAGVWEVSRGISASGGPGQLRIRRSSVEQWLKDPNRLTDSDRRPEQAS